MLTEGHKSLDSDGQPSEWVTVLEAAARLNTHVETVRRRLRTGELVGQRRQPPRGGSQWFVRMPTTSTVTDSTRVDTRVEPVVSGNDLANQVKALVAEAVEKVRVSNTQPPPDEVTQSITPDHDIAREHIADLRAHVGRLEALLALREASDNARADDARDHIARLEALLASRDAEVARLVEALTALTTSRLPGPRPWWKVW